MDWQPHASDVEVSYSIRGDLLRQPVAFAKAVHGANLTVPQSQAVGVVTESGSGKTMLGMATLRLIRTPPSTSPRRLSTKSRSEGGILLSRKLRGPAQLPAGRQVSKPIHPDAAPEPSAVHSAPFFKKLQKLGFRRRGTNRKASMAGNEHTD